MGFLKKLFGSRKKEEDKVDKEFIEDQIENKEEVNDEIINEPIEMDNENSISVDDNNDATRVIDKPLEITDEESLLHDDEVNDEPAQPRNFKYLDDLIHSGVKEIVFDSNIILEDNEESNYKEGIKLDVDDLIIDGNGYAIDACGKARIFYCTGKNVSIKNTTLKNGFSKENAGAIYNEGNLTISGSIFNSNKSNWGGAITNDGGEITIIESVFEENTAIWVGGAINNNGDLKILKSTLKDNSTKTGGAIYNNSNLLVSDSIFKNNTSESGGAIYGKYGKVHIEKTTFAVNFATGKLGVVVQ